MALDLNINPYYDDFDENKNYHKILFKPGNAIQARELTQIQTILQDQIKKLGKFVLSDGSRVSGAKISVNNNTKIIKLSNTDAQAISNIYNFLDLFVVGEQSKLIANIFKIDASNFYLFVKPLNTTLTNSFLANERVFIFDTKELALSYVINENIQPTYISLISSDISTPISNASGLKYSKILNVNTLNLKVGDIISSPSLTNTYEVTEIIDGSSCFVNQQIEKDFTNIKIIASTPASNQLIDIGVTDGIFFTNGYFVKNSSQNIVVNSVSAFPSAVIGFQVKESISNFIDDSSLLDPALGASNYSSPGADRYVIELELISKPLVDDILQDLTDEKFIELIRLKRGEIIKINENPILGELENTLARQMFDHAGNYTVKPFTLSFSETEFVNSSNTFNLQISPGKAYIFGKEFETIYPISIETEKPRDTATNENYNVQTYYGNFIEIKDLYGSIDPQTNPTIELHSANSSQSFSSKLGTAEIRNFKYLSENQYNLYLYDIKLNKTSSIKDVKSVLINTSSNNYSTQLFKANTILNSSGNTVITDVKSQTLVYNFPHEYVSNVFNVEYDSSLIIQKTFSSNSATIFSGSLSKQILGGIGEIPSALKKQYFRIVCKTTNGSYLQNEEIDLDDTTITISSTTSEYTATIQIINGKSFSGTADVFYTIQNNNAQPKLKTLNSNKIVCLSANSYSTSLQYADILKLNSVYKISSNSNTSIYKGEWSSSQQYLIGEYVFSNSVLYSAQYNNINSNPSTENNINWKLVIPDYAISYSLDNGQRESYYDHGNFILQNAKDFGTYVISFDYFSHSSGGYCSLSSYPSTVLYKDIPSFIVSNKKYNLRDCIDFRPRRKDLSNSLTFDSYEIPAATFSGCDLSYSYYLPRIDSFILTSNKKLKIVKGVSKINPTPPKIQEDALTLATIFYNPYGLSFKDIRFSYDSHRRYTMDDIGELDKRITRNEYYTALTLSESGALNKSSSDLLLSQRLRSGFLADSFSSLQIADLLDDDFYSQINIDEETCSPVQLFDQLNLNYDENSFSFNSLENNLLHVPYYVDDNLSILASNLNATSTTSINIFDVVSFVGTLKIDPPYDVWIDTQYYPEDIPPWLTEGSNNLVDDTSNKKTDSDNNDITKKPHVIMELAGNRIISKYQ